MSKASRQREHEDLRAAHAETTALKRAYEAEVLAKIEKYAKDGDATLVIAERLGVSKNKVIRVRKELGLSSSKSPLYTLPNGTP